MLLIFNEFRLNCIAFIETGGGTLIATATHTTETTDMSYQRQKLRQIEDQISPVITRVEIDQSEIARALKRAERLRSEQFVTMASAGKRALTALIARLAAWNSRQRAAQRLRQLDSHLLADIGLSRADIARAVANGRAAENTAMQVNATCGPDGIPADIPVRHKYAL
jgi:uncharacterized protein YjiS (DUF1127 family)